MSITSCKLADSLLMKQGVVLINAIDASKITDVKEVHAGTSQGVRWVVIVQNSLLFAMPLGLGWLHAYVIDPVRTALQPHHLDVFLAEFVGKRLVVGHEIWLC